MKRRSGGSLQRKSLARENARWLRFLILVGSASFLSFYISHRNLHWLLEEEQALVQALMAIDNHNHTVVQSRNADVHEQHGQSPVQRALHHFRLGHKAGPFHDFKSHHHNIATLHQETFVFERDSLCPACHTTYAAKTLTCGNRIHKYLALGQPISQAAATVLHEFPQTCGPVCRPDACDESEKILWRYDDAGPLELAAQTHTLHSIIEQYRLPPHVNVSEFLADKKNQYPRRMYLFEHNPSIVILPESYKDFRLPNIDAKPVYLASYRVTNEQGCVTGDDELAMIGNRWPRPKAENLLGLAVLDENLQILDDVVVDLKLINYRMEDFRLYVLKGQIYVSSYSLLVPIWLHLPPDDRNKMTMPNVFPSNLTVIARKSVSCHPNTPLRKRGKNLNYFYDPHIDQVIVEVWPMGTKLDMDVDNKCHTEGDEELPPAKASELPPPSFHNIDELHLSPDKILTGDRGAYCCLPYTNGTDEYLLGIAHSHLTKDEVENVGHVNPYTFFSRFYLMEAKAPYKTVARSGKFCLGFPESEAEFESNPYSKMNMDQLVVGDTFNCPRVHFVTGMTYKAGDPSRVILGYGVNDCIPRFIEVAMEEIWDMLFPTEAHLHEHAMEIGHITSALNKTMNE